MHIPSGIMVILFLCLLFLVFILTNRKQLFIRMHRNVVAVNLYELKNLRRLYEGVAKGTQSFDSLIKRIHLFQLNIQKTIENATTVIATDPAFKDKKENRAYINATDAANKQLERIYTLAKNFEDFIVKRRTM